MRADDANGLIDYGLISKGAIAVQDGKIVWVGETQDIQDAVDTNQVKTLDCQGRLVTPGLIDCHTHLVYGGDRTKEFELRLNGATYSEIAAAGGGIVSTVAATRASTEDELFDSAKNRLATFMAEGVTTVEIKSGYGLDLDNELKMLSVARKLGEQLPINVTTTFLGAHTTPPEYKDNSDAYIDLVCDQMIPAVAAKGLADSVDAFCENIAFSAQQVQRVFQAAQKHGLAIKLHAEQLSDQKGAVLAASMGAQSVDHIEFLNEVDVAAVKASGTIAVLLPGAFYFLRETQLPPIPALRQHKVPMAIASDSNPGSSPVSSLLLMLSMACTLFKLTPAEALASVTRNAAKALGLDHQIGTLEVGKHADMVLWNTTDPAALSYRIGDNPCQTVMFKGSVR